MRFWIDRLMPKINEILNDVKVRCSNKCFNKNGLYSWKLKSKTMTTKEVADKLVGYCRQGQFDTAVSELYAQDIVSIEPDGAPMKEARGLEQVIAKGQQFMESVEEFHSNVVSDPVVADNFFSCSMKMDVTFKGMGRTTMEEVCLYKVKDGKISEEQFFFTPMVPQG